LHVTQTYQDKNIIGLPNDRQYHYIICYQPYQSFISYLFCFDNTEGAIKSGQSRETDNIEYTRRRKTKQKHNTICVRHHYTQANTNNVNKTWALLQTITTPFKVIGNLYAHEHTSVDTQLPIKWKTKTKPILSEHFQNQI
jgi:hypothetical protein